MKLVELLFSSSEVEFDVELFQLYFAVELLELDISGFNKKLSLFIYYYKLYFNLDLD